jgi:DNA topoisomerase I
MFRDSPEFRKNAIIILAQPALMPTRGKVESKDHPPIYPVACARKTSLYEKHRKLYELIARRFFATLSGPCEWDVTRAGIDIGGEPFVDNGKRLAVSGWRFHYIYGMPKEEMLPQLSVGDTLAVKKADLLEKKTEPPKR